MGYPDGLAGTDIPLTARILCVADVYDALTTARSDGPALTHAEAMRIMERDSGTAFDPTMFQLFGRLLDAQRNQSRSAGRHAQASLRAAAWPGRSSSARTTSASALTLRRPASTLQPMTRSQRTTAANAPRAALKFSAINAILLIAGLIAIVIGYLLLAQGSTVAAPLLLVLGYAVLVPLGIIL